MKGEKGVTVVDKPVLPVSKPTYSPLYEAARTYKNPSQNKYYLTVCIQRTDVSANEIGRAAVKAGMTRMRADGLTKAAQGVTPIEEIMRTTV
jgi:hypothetical protein